MIYLLYWGHQNCKCSPNNFSDEAAQYLIDLCTVVGITTDRLFIVAGNHDVDRNMAGRDEAIKKNLFSTKRIL